MFCFQCQEALNNKGCTKIGVCGKNEPTSNLQDLLIYVCKGISFRCERLRENGIDPGKKADLFILEALFTTITNVNFDKIRVFKMIKKGFKIKSDLEKKCVGKCKKTKNPPDCAVWEMEGGIEKFEQFAKMIGILSVENENIRSLRELLITGLKGISAYADHSYILGEQSPKICRFIQRALDRTTDDSITTDELLALIMEAGKVSVDVMALLDKANTQRYGYPEITEVYTGTLKGPGILVSGHDLLDLEELLKQTKGKSVNVYTHGEMLPANAYPKFKKYKHLIGNYGTSWYNQQKEFTKFNGPVLMTTNCLVKPLDNYIDRIYTTGLVAHTGVKHIKVLRNKKDFTEIIETAKKLQDVGEMKGAKLIIGFSKNTLMANAENILKLVSSGKIKRFFVMSGCDGRDKKRNYYTEFAKKLPEDTVILTSGCAKYRYNSLKLGSIAGIPRVLDAGQCNDSYSLAYIALQLKDILKVKDINDLPISFNVAWYEQKAVCVLLALLYLGFKNIRIGPSIPAFISKDVLKILSKEFSLKPIGDIEKDMKEMMAGK